MPRCLLIPLVALVLVGCGRKPAPEADEPRAAVSPNVTIAPNVRTSSGREVAVAPMPREVGSHVASGPLLPVAPFPHEPGEFTDLTNEDPGLDSKLEVALPEIERLDKANVDTAVTNDPVGQPGPPGVGLPGNDPLGPGQGVVLTSFSGRTGATKDKLIREFGGNAESERAVALGLSWLARQQLQDGGWGFDGSDKADRTAATGLALLPFLAAGETHKQAMKYQKNVADGITFLTKACPIAGPNAGKFEGASATGQALATIALCEAYGQTRDPLLRAHAQAAINYIQKSQAADGGWSDKPDGKSDLATAGWHMQALQVAKQTKELVVDDRVTKKAVQFLDSMAGGSRKEMYGTVDKSDAKPGTAATATGLLCRYYLDGWAPRNLGMIDGVAGGLAKNQPSATNRDPLYLYYATQLVQVYEGEEWKNWNEGPKAADGTRKGGARDLLIGEQVRKDGPTLGSWDADGDAGKRYGRLGTTALRLLTLEVYYRYLPLSRLGGDALIDGPPTAPGTFAGRSGATKTKLIQHYGGNAESERAVALGLAWLAKQQKKDGSWEFDGTTKETAAATGFAVLAFLGAGENHKDLNGKYRQTVKAGVDWLAKATTPNGANAGRLSTNAYANGIAALALVEAYGVTRDAALKPTAQAAVNYVQRAQGANGSWGYAFGTNGDTSICGWQLQALSAAKHAGLVVDDRVIKKALAFLDTTAAGPQKDRYGYTNNTSAAPGTALTAVGLWCRLAVDDWASNTPGLMSGAEGLLKRPAAKDRLDLYYLHYATLVMRSAGDAAWADWNEGPKAADGTRKGGMRDVLVGAQVKAPGTTLGSWDPDRAFIGASCGRVGTTALCVLSLESYYRYAPVAKKEPNPKK